MTALIPNPWINESAQSLPPAASPAAGVDFPSASVATNSVSPGEPCRSLPSGETEPSVTLVCAPGESESLRGDRQAAVEPSIPDMKCSTAVTISERDMNCIPELLAALNNMGKHPCDLDALRVNKEKIDRNSYPEDREQLKFLRGIEPIYYDVIKRKLRPAFLRALLGEPA